MHNPYRPLPPLGALVGFEAAARLGGFSLAAQELNITQSAISHQIRTLEAHLGQPLFLRTGRRVELTDAGRDLHRTAETALETVRQGLRRLEAYSKPGSIVLHMPAHIGAAWFLPRLPALRAALPGVEPWLHTGDGHGPLSESEIDITLRMAPATSPEETSVPFLREVRAPFCAPGHLAAFQSAPETAALVHDEADADWQAWCQMAGITRADYASGVNFSDSVLALEAAAQGLGVALGDPVLAAPHLATGRLVRADPRQIKTARHWHLAALTRSLDRPGARALWDWLCAEAPDA